MNNLEVNLNDYNEIVISGDEIRLGWCVISPVEARNLSQLLSNKAFEAIANTVKKEDEIRREKAENTPVDRSSITLANGLPVTPDYKELKENGQQKEYVVLSNEERAKGFVRPVRRTYKHIKCGQTTTMGQSIAETYARDPKFYGGTFCCNCGKHFPLIANDEWQFTWIDDNSFVGT